MKKTQIKQYKQISSSSSSVIPMLIHNSIKILQNDLLAKDFKITIGNKKKLSELFNYVPDNKTQSAAVMWNVQSPSFLKIKYENLISNMFNLNSSFNREGPFKKEY